jgi:branched-chain amino acid transport system ATP-binding protein
VVEQDVAIALELAQHAVVMDTGRITHAGRSSELAHDPAIQKAYLGTL